MTQGFKVYNSNKFIQIDSTYQNMHCVKKSTVVLPKATLTSDGYANRNPYRYNVQKQNNIVAVRKIENMGAFNNMLVSIEPRLDSTGKAYYNISTTNTDADETVILYEYSLENSKSPATHGVRVYNSATKALVFDSGYAPLNVMDYTKITLPTSGGVVINPDISRTLDPNKLYAYTAFENFVSWVINDVNFYLGVGAFAHYTSDTGETIVRYVRSGGRISIPRYSGLTTYQDPHVTFLITDVTNI